MAAELEELLVDTIQEGVAVVHLAALHIRVGMVEQMEDKVAMVTVPPAILDTVLLYYPMVAAAVVVAQDKVVKEDKVLFGEVAVEVEENAKTLVMGEVEEVDQQQFYHHLEQMKAK